MGKPAIAVSDGDTPAKFVLISAFAVAPDGTVEDAETLTLRGGSPRQQTQIAGFPRSRAESSPVLGAFPIRKRD